MEINYWVNNFIKVIVGVVGLMWVLLKYIISGHSKKLDKHFEDFNTFKEFQQEENSKNQNHRHKYENFDKAVIKLIEDNESRVSDKIDRAINPLTNSIHALTESVNIIMQHILNSKNGK